MATLLDWAGADRASYRIGQASKSAVDRGWAWRDLPWSDGLRPRMSSGSATSCRSSPGIVRFPVDSRRDPGSKRPWFGREPRAAWFTLIIYSQNDSITFAY